MKFKILQLSDQTLIKSISLLTEIFTYEPDRKSIQINLRESLSNDNPNESYWVAVVDDNKVVGITGLYIKDTDNKNTVRLGWFGVHPGYRKQGIGSGLLKFTINEAQKRRYSTLKLYTSNDPNELNAHKLYENFGFNRINDNNDSDKIFYTKGI